MKGGLIVSEVVPSELIQALANRDAALWVGKGLSSTPADLHRLVALVRLPWRLVIVEDDSEELALALDQHASDEQSNLEYRRGFIQIIARDPTGVILPQRVLPIYLLNGRKGAILADDSPRLGERQSLRRRLNMTGALLETKPNTLLVLGGTENSTIGDVQGLWSEGLRTTLVFAACSVSNTAAVSTWLASADSPQTVTLCTNGFDAFADQILEEVRTAYDSVKTVVRFRTLAGAHRLLDITAAEQVQSPLLDRYNIIHERDLHRLLPFELKEKDFNAFFDRSSESWKPYAAGLPFWRTTDAKSKVEKALRRVEVAGPDENRLLVIPSEPGAGGTTLARQLAFECASAGFPTLLASQVTFRPDFTEISRFMLRVRQIAVGNQGGETSGESESEKLQEVPWLLVFDAQHFRGQENLLESFIRNFTRERRPVVILVVIEADRYREHDIPGSQICDTLSHSISKVDAELVGSHINQFLTPLGKAKTPDQWRSFWENHGPKIGSFGTHPAAFWVALEFWIKGQLDLSQSVQQWLFTQFKQAKMSSALRKELLTIAALSVERQSYPEGLLPTSSPSEYPFTVQLEQVRRDVPGMALGRFSTENGRYWAVAHDLLARYLLTAIVRDEAMLEELGLRHVREPVDLRLELISALARRPELSRQSFSSLADEFAVNILKLDRGHNREFFSHWKQVLSALEGLPEAVWNTSRVVNHHVAISRRRVATDDQLFSLTIEEQRDQLELAIEHLNFAIYNLVAKDDEEPNVNLFNSLALAYQNLAALERSCGTDIEIVKKLAQQGTEAARKAQEEDPSNSYTLETLARDLIQNGEIYPDQAVQSACQALQHVFRALTLDSAPNRRQKLSELTGRAIKLLRGPKAAGEVESLYLARKPVGYAAKAWLILGESGHPLDGVDSFKSISKEVLMRALGVLSEMPPNERDWLILNLQYDLLSAASPLDFSGQHKILTDMLISNIKLDIQQELEYAILLHMNGLHQQGNNAFFSLRKRIQKQDAFVRVPDRLRVFVDPNTGKPILCDMVVIDSGGYRSRAKVLEFLDADVPFIPQDFGSNELLVRTRLKCYVHFGHKGPLAKPPN